MRARHARAEDADAIAELLMRGFATYTRWAPDWAPTEELRAQQHDAWRAGLLDPEAWTLVAEAGGSLVAVARFAPARAERRKGELVPGLAHLGALFVDPEWWGRGLGRRMLAAATEEMRGRGYERVRLLVPEGNDRALELYERHGFERVRPWPEDLFGLRVIECRLELGRR